MAFRLHTSLAFFIVVLFNQAAWSQSGSWQPAGADLRYPRILLKASQVEAVRASLATPATHALYAGVYGSATAAPPANNEQTTHRRLQAQIAKNAAFVLYLNRRPLSAGALADLSPTEASQLTDKVRGLLENLNPLVDTLEKYSEWQWRSKELIDFMVAYDLLRGAGVPVASLEASRARLQSFAGNLYAKATEPYRNSFVFFDYIKNNHALMTAAALGVSAVVLNDVESATPAQQPANWLNAGLYHLDNVLWRDAQRQSEPGVVAGYYEGPYYFKYAFLNCLPFIRAMGHFLPDGDLVCSWGASSRQVRNPAFDSNYDLLYDWVTAITLPDGRLPALEDSFVDMAMPELALTGKSKYVHPLHLQHLAPTQLNSLSKQLDGTVDMRAAYIAANVPALPPTPAALTALPKSGNLIFRSGQDAEASYLHLYGKHGNALANTGGHNQGDASSFSLYAKGQLLALDPGYISSGRRQELGNAPDHNLILVDGAGPRIGAPGTPRDAEAFIENTFATPNLTYGEVRTAYQAADIVRKTLFIRNEYFLMADFVTAAQPHQYTWQLHGYGLEGGTAAEGTFAADFAHHTGRWTKNSVSLLAHVTATSGASHYDKITSPHEFTYNQTQNHTTLLVQKANEANTQFLAALYPYTTAEPVIATIEAPEMAALKTDANGYKDLAFTQRGTSLQTVQTAGFPHSVRSDASLTFFSLAPNQTFAQAFIQHGTSLSYGPGALLQVSERSDVAWQQSSPAVFEGYLSKAAVLTLAVSGRPVAVQGPGITDWRYLEEEKQLQLTFSGPSSFRYQEQQNVPGAPETDAVGSSLEVWPVPARQVINIKAGQRTRPLSARLYSAEGKSVLEMQFVEHTQLPVAGLSPGVYFLHVYSEGVPPQVRKVVVVR